ncbi:putative lipoprotein DUF2291 [Mucilaginibacter gracilis]|uniref:Periplasmic lipoprotein n=2 Tax=Mucilaginibacter TaxID=423349 RepID=H1YHQ2_9SPHI|nr:MULTISPECIES: DUF2291 domain-containing protein [Mucilaginibacter]EHQ27452.1 periplasmic lipoprotein [Mucilaginibacter paludis DSM 18603]RKR81019.1 putative lipoprotein DUF2291 [Mucilaginibacter gracilis]
MRKEIKYAIWFVIIIFIGYNSVYFRKLSELKATGKTFNAVAYAQDLLTNKLPAVTEKAITLDELITQLKVSPANTFAENGHVLSIGSTKFFMVKGTGTITDMDDSDVKLSTIAHNDFQIATEFVFGNAIRDASGLVDLNDFTNTVDLSNISSEINKIIRAKVIPPFKSAAKKGDKIEFTGAVELNQAHLNLNDIEMLPVSLKIIP